MKTRLVKIGNSRGLRLPKVLIEEAGLPDDVELHVRGATIVVAPRRRPREGWAEAARDLHVRDGGSLLDPPTSTRFDEEDWSW